MGSPRYANLYTGLFWMEHANSDSVNGIGDNFAACCPSDFGNCCRSSLPAFVEIQDRGFAAIIMIHEANPA